ncbi:hypothetical protein BDR04DRAFT_1116960 [Suillus decipiens]|nr:hypothetical protein BDR04DRAFT_1116960 [Suillus decipiens]
MTAHDLPNPLSCGVTDIKRKCYALAGYKAELEKYPVVVAREILAIPSVFSLIVPYAQSACVRLPNRGSCMECELYGWRTLSWSQTIYLDSQGGESKVIASTPVESQGEQKVKIVRLLKDFLYLGESMAFKAKTGWTMGTSTGRSSACCVIPRRTPAKYIRSAGSAVSRNPSRQAT